MIDIQEESIKIQLELYGVTHYGSYTVKKRQDKYELNVYGRSWKKKTITRDINLKQLALQMLGSIIREKFTPIEKIAPTLPSSIREAVYCYLNDIILDENDLDYLPDHALIDAFGEQLVGSQNHKKVSWFCLNVMKSILPAWEAYCDEPTVTQIYQKLVSHLQDDVAIDNWEELWLPPIPIRNGYRITDCAVSMVEPIAEGISNTAKYLHSGNSRIAGDVLFNAWCAADEGGWSRKYSVSFEDWVVSVALPAALDCQEVNINSL